MSIMTYIPYRPPELSPREQQELLWMTRGFYDNQGSLCHICYKKDKVKSSETIGWQLCDSCYKNGWRSPLKRVLIENRSALVYDATTFKLTIFLHPK